MNANLLNERIAMLQTDVAAICAERDALRNALSNLNYLTNCKANDKQAPQPNCDCCTCEGSRLAIAALSIPGASNEPAKVDRAQAQNDYNNALREYERVHSLWTNTPQFTPESALVKIRLDNAREQYLKAYRIANPTHLAM